MKIYLSPSSQWGNTYSYGKHNEAEICGIIAEHAAVALKRNGYEVKVGDNVKWGMAERTKESNAWGADYHVPIHTNAGGGEGTVVFASSKNLGNKYVKAVYNALADLTPTKDRNVRAYDGLYEVVYPKAVTIYTETDFHDNAKIAKWIVDNTVNIGEAIAKGFCNADGKEYIGVNGTPTATQPTGKKTVEEVAKEVISGKYGNYPERKVNLEKDGYSYAEVQAKVDELMGKKTATEAFKPYLVKKTCDVLNIRSGAGTHFSIVGKIDITNDYKYTIVEEKSGKGSDKGWGRLKSGAGWIALDWVRKV